MLSRTTLASNCFSRKDMFSLIILSSSSVAVFILIFVGTKFFLSKIFLIFYEY